MIARAHINDTVFAELTARMTALAAAGVADASSLAAYPKLAAGLFTPDRARLGMEIGRMATVVWDDDEPERAGVATSYLTARGRAIAGGTNQMMRNVIAERLLDLPREVSFDRDLPFAEVVRRAASWDPSRP
jgi:alkylation response protein AidB-like acyl-CoA dehydrogenase